MAPAPYQEIKQKIFREYCAEDKKPHWGKAYATMPLLAGKQEFRRDHSIHYNTDNQQADQAHMQIASLALTT